MSCSQYNGLEVLKQPVSAAADTMSAAADNEPKCKIMDSLTLFQVPNYLFSLSKHTNEESAITNVKTRKYIRIGQIRVWSSLNLPMYRV